MTRSRCLQKCDTLKPVACYANPVISMQKVQNKKRRAIPSCYVIYERNGKSGYVASVPALPGCVVYGKTLQEAYRNIQAAIQECLEVILDFQKELPRETIRRTVIEKLSFVTPGAYA